MFICELISATPVKPEPPSLINTFNNEPPTSINVKTALPIVTFVESCE